MINDMLALYCCNLVFCLCGPFLVFFLPFVGGPALQPVVFFRHLFELPGRNRVREERRQVAHELVG